MNKIFAIDQDGITHWDDLVWASFEYLPDWALTKVAILDAAADEDGVASIEGVGRRQVNSFGPGWEGEVMYVIEIWK